MSFLRTRLTFENEQLVSILKSKLSIDGNSWIENAILISDKYNFVFLKECRKN